jgi:energy-coupling factor transporter ATP-binding protein EcfA2
LRPIHPLLLLDEPFAGLGSSEIEPLAKLIKSLHRSKRLTILIIERTLREFMQLVTEVIVRTSTRRQDHLVESDRTHRGHNHRPPQRTPARRSAGPQGCCLQDLPIGLKSDDSFLSFRC